MDLIGQKQNKDCLLQNRNSSFINIEVQFEAVLKIVDHVQGQGVNRFESRAYTLVFEHFESVYNTGIGR
jgi:glutathione synthase/RimK-type ligase-like ATP-grasp enzyme